MPLNKEQDNQQLPNYLTLNLHKGRCLLKAPAALAQRTAGIPFYPKEALPVKALLGGEGVLCSQLLYRLGKEAH